MTLSLNGTSDGAAAPAPLTSATVGEVALAAAASRSGDALTGPAGATSFDELGRAVREIAGGLAALGVEAGDRVAILAGTRPEWTLADFGALCAGAVVVPVYHTNSPEECGYVLGHSEARVVVCEDAAQAAKVAAVRDELPGLEHVVVMEGAADGTIGLAELRRSGAAAADGLPEARLADVASDDPATIVYTSGTTGPPKGCVLTHANLLATAAMYESRLDLREPVIYLYLPLAHALARVVEIVCVDTGGTLAFWSGDSTAIPADLARIRPTHFPSVPRVFEKAHSTVTSRAADGSALQGEVFARALATGARVRRRTRAGEPVGMLDRARHALADRLVLSRVRAAFGGRIVLGLTGAAPIGRELLEFFDACGVLLLEGYGMTETCAASALNTPQELRFGSVGRPLPGTSVGIAADGEVLLRGPHVFPGYHRDPEATAEALEDGWMRTGDLGTLDDGGYLTITGRKKELIITSSGKNISPDNLESALRETRWIANAVVCGDRRSYLVALLTLDPEAIGKLADEAGVAPDPVAMASDEGVREIVGRDVEAVNARVARIEQVKRFAILPRDLTQADGELTPTLKIRRPTVHERYAAEIDALYAP